MGKDRLQYANIDIPVPHDFVGTVTQPASASAGQPVYVEFFTNPLMPTYSQSQRQTPSSEDDVLYGMYIDDSNADGNATVTVDGVVKFFVNNVDTEIIWGELSKTNLNLRNPKKFGSSPIVVNRNEILQIMFIPKNANTTGEALTQTINFEYMRIPASYTGKVTLPS